MQGRQALHRSLMASGVGCAKEERRALFVQREKRQYHDTIRRLVPDQPQKLHHRHRIRLHEAQERIQSQHVQQQRVFVSDDRQRLDARVD